MLKWGRARGSITKTTSWHGLRVRDGGSRARFSCDYSKLCSVDGKFLADLTWKHKPKTWPAIRARRTSNIQVLHVQRIVFDELASCFYVFTHQRGEDGFGFGQVFELHGEQRAALGIHSRFPELL